MDVRAFAYTASLRMQLGLCCSSLQHAFARSLADLLERNLGITTLIIEDDSAPISAIWDQATAADAVLLLLDSISAPGQVNRRDWESLLEHAGTPPVAIVRLEACHYPKLLERRPLFLAASVAIEAWRWVESWLAGLLLPRDEEGIEPASSSAAPAPDEWWARLVDQPGTCFAAADEGGAAQGFARAARRHFQGVFWIGCERRPEAAILDEIEHWSRGATRLLFILVHTQYPPDLPGGRRHSYLVLEGKPPVVHSDDPLSLWVGVCQASGFPGSMMDLMLGRRTEEWESLVTVLDRKRRLYRPPGRFITNRKARQRHLEVLAETFHNWRLQLPLCRELAGETGVALRYGFECASPAARELCLDFALFLQAEKRHPEAVGWLRTVLEAAEQESDLSTACRARKELSWLVDDAGAVVPDVVAVGEQLAFDFRE